MSILIKDMEMPKDCNKCPFGKEKQFDVGIVCTLLDGTTFDTTSRPTSMCPLIELPPHGDLIDRDALMKDGWLSLWKRVDYMGGYAIHDLPLKNPSIPVVIEKENC